MLSKYIKSVFILFLILSFNINSYAAISVSDGSSFVTKAEFSSDLNNISSRLSQVENSLDAKIDSLVSSYLSRNGIWNGAVQTLATLSTYPYYGYFQSGTTKNNFVVLRFHALDGNGYPLGNVTAGNAWTRKDTTSGVLVLAASYNSAYGQKKTVVSKLNKSGMAVVNYTIYIYKRSAIYFRYSNFVDGSVTVAGYFEFSDGSNTVAVSPYTWEKIHDGAGHAEGDPYYNSGNYNYQGVITLFVAKDNALTVQAIDRSGYSSFVGVSYTGGGYISACALNPTKVTIY